jgi:hypothetical protein
LGNNFLIAYERRVGSSALVESLTRVPKFSVPIFEDLDRYNIVSQGLINQWNEDTIHTLVDKTYKDASRRNSDFTIGFKWRLWGHPNVMNENRVAVFNMVRSDFLEFVSSIYMTDVVYKDSNAPQFKLVRSEGTDRTDILNKYRDSIVEVDIDKFVELWKNLFWVELERIRYLSKMKDLGVGVSTIFYEDFAYKRYHFMNAFLRGLGREPTHKIYNGAFKKVSSPYPSESFLNRNELLENNNVAELMALWENTIYNGEIDIFAVR